MSFLDLITLLSFVGLNVDLILQARKIHHVKSSIDVSIPGLIIRFFAIFIILYKLIRLNDVALIVGQALVAITFTIYLLVVINYLPRRKTNKRRKR